MEKRVSRVNLNDNSIDNTHTECVKRAKREEFPRFCVINWPQCDNPSCMD